MNKRQAKKKYKGTKNFKNQIEKYGLKKCEICKWADKSKKIGKHCGLKQYVDCLYYNEVNDEKIRVIRGNREART